MTFAGETSKRLQSLVLKVLNSGFVHKDDGSNVVHRDLEAVFQGLEETGKVVFTPNLVLNLYSKICGNAVDLHHALETKAGTHSDLV